MPKLIYICILLIYFKVISKKGGHYCPRLPYMMQLAEDRAKRFEHDDLTIEANAGLRS